MNKVMLTAGIVLIIAIGMSIDSYANDEEFDNFENQLKEFRIEKRIPGLAIGVVKDKQLAWSIGLGYADRNRTVPVTTDTPFWIASLTKTFVGLAYLHLAHQQKIELNEPAAETPGFEGLCNWLASSTIPFAEGLNCEARITIRDILHHQVNDPPGSQFMYNPIMYSRLSRHLEHKFGDGIEAVEGRHNYLGQVIDKEILKPAKMGRTMATMWDRTKLDIYFELADGFKVDTSGRKTKLPRPDKHIAGGGGIVSTVNDLAKYEIALSEGVIVPKGAEEKLLRSADFISGDRSPYGFGWYFQCHEGVKLMWHGGWDPDSGYSALYLRAPKKGIAMIALANSENGLWWGNSLTEAQVEKSALAKLFIDTFIDQSDHHYDSDCPRKSK